MEGNQPNGSADECWSPLSRSDVIWAWISLSLILALGVTVRSVGLENESLWLDELIAADWAYQETLAEVLHQFTYRDEVHPPGFHIVQFCTMSLFGNSPAAIRLSAAIGGVLSIVAVARLAYVLYGYPTAILSAGAITILWYPIYYSQDARPYSLLTFSCTWLVCSLWQIVFCEPPKSRHLARCIAQAGIAGTLCAYLHYFGLAFSWFMLGIFAWLGWSRKTTRYVISVAGICGMAYLPWVPWAAQQLSSVQLNYLPTPGVSFLLELGRSFFNQSTLLLVTAAVLVGISILDAARRWQSSQGRSLPSIACLVLILWAFVPTLSSVAVSQLRPVVTQYILLFTLPPICILVVRGWMVCAGEMRIKPAVLLCGLLLALGTIDLVFGLSYYHRRQKEQFREVVRYAVETASPEEPILAYASWGWYMDNYFNYYFDRLDGSRRAAFAFGDSMNRKKLQDFLSDPRNRSFWVLYRARGMPPILSALEREGFTVDRSQAFIAVGACRLVRTNSSPEEA